MARPTLTPWFDTHIKPTRVGPYETVTDGIQGWSWWQGEEWCAQSTSRETCSKTNTFGADQNKRWRAHAKPYQGYKEEEEA